MEMSQAYFIDIIKEFLPFSLHVVLVVDIVSVGVDDGDDIVVNVEVMLLVVGVVTLGGPASAHTSIADGCVSFARFSSVGFVSTRGNVHIDGLELSSVDMSMLNGFVVVEFTFVDVISREFELSDDGMGGGVQMELDE